MGVAFIRPFATSPVCLSACLSPCPLVSLCICVCACVFAAHLSLLQLLPRVVLNQIPNTKYSMLLSGQCAQLRFGFTCNHSGKGAFPTFHILLFRLFLRTCPLASCRGDNEEIETNFLSHANAKILRLVAHGKQAEQARNLQSNEPDSQIP